MTARAQEIIKLGWLQWVTVSATTLSRYYNDTRLSEDYYVVATQSCDLAHGNFCNEPYAELIGFSLLEDISAELTRASNSRILHLEATQDGAQHKLGFYIRERFFIQRECLATFEPDKPFEFGGDVCLQLSTWLAAKYYRASFSDEFNHHWTRVLGKIKEKVGKSYKRFGDVLTGVFVATRDDPEKNDFKASWLIVYSNSKVSNHGNREGVNKFLGEWEESLDEYLRNNQYEGTVSILSTDEVTLGQLEGHKRLFLDDACFRGEEPGEVEHQMG